MSIRLRSLCDILLCVVLVGAGFGCRREEETARNDRSSDTPAPQQVGVVVFPDDLRVEDASVNDFLQQAMTVCTTGDYEAFRLLWSARRDPLPRDEFEQGWQAVLEIRIQALEKAILASDSEGGPGEQRIVYAVYVDVRLDPAHLAGRREPERQVVLMLVQEHDEWRLAEAPEQVRTWLREKVAAASADAAKKPEQAEPEAEDSG